LFLLDYVLSGNFILTEVELFGSFYLKFEFTPLYGLYHVSKTVKYLTINKKIGEVEFPYLKIREVAA